MELDANRHQGFDDHRERREEELYGLTPAEKDQSWLRSVKSSTSDAQKLAMSKLHEAVEAKASMAACMLAVRHTDSYFQYCNNLVTFGTLTWAQVKTIDSEIWGTNG